ncbi:MAG: glycosyltransferase family 2 protein [Scytolyngbya sp. HA4215-MV1]|jgi:glycosyltransferase involved in cell wall biosynthesis|nr:glycosyltransferase family 2 protein [Scytolyngbya sp. HA4215-MV1]
MLEKITPLILTFNEANNLDRTLEKLSWAGEIVIVDSYSTDSTLAILARHPQAKVFQRKFDSFAEQCNYGLTKIQTEWVLSLDADYVLSDALVDEMSQLSENPQINSYFVRFKYCVFGKPLRGTLYPPRRVLYRKDQAIYHQDGHAHRVIVTGETAFLENWIDHDDRKSLSRWLWAQDRYMITESKKLLNTSWKQLSPGDRIRRCKVFAPLAILFYCLIINRGILDGWAGWYYAFQRMLAELLLSIHLMEQETLR